MHAWGMARTRTRSSSRKNVALCAFIIFLILRVRVFKPVTIMMANVSCDVTRKGECGMSVLHASMPAAPLVALEYSGVELYPHDRHQLRHAHF